MAPRPPSAQPETAAALLDALVSSLPGGAAVVDTSGRVCACNARFVQHLGLTTEEMPTMDLLALQWRSDAGDPIDPKHAPVARALRGERVDPRRVILTLPDGRASELELGAEALRSQGTLSGALVTTRLASPVEARGEEPAGRFAFAVARADGTLEYVSALLLRLLGRGGGAALHTLAELLPAGAARPLADGEPFAEREARLRTTGAAEVPVHSVALPLSEGRTAFFFSSGGAGNELVGLERQARLAAESANRMKDEFLAMVSHELRTPLNAVMGWANMLKVRRSDARALERGLDSIERNARVLTKLVEDLLDLGRIVSGKLQVNLRPLDLRGPAQAAVDVVKPAAEAKRLQLSVELGSAPVMGAADPERLQQVVLNLLVNAVKFTPSGGQVELTLSRSDADVLFRVRDTGCGIAPAFMPYLFERFRQSEGTLLKVQGGIGLGLAIVRHLVELHGGRVWATSPGEGAGATFFVALPLLPSAGAP